MKKFNFKKHWWKILIGIIAAFFLSLGIFIYIKAKPAVDFVRQNFASTQIDDKNTAAEPFILYISAIDTRDGSMPEKARSDLNILAVINPRTKKAMLVNIPRDYYVNLSGINQMDKLTHASDVGGIELSQKTIEELLDIKIDRTIRVNFNALEGVVDAIGGITINSDQGNSYACYHDKTCIINPGLNTLDGRCAVAFARERLSYQEGDLKRAENQETVLTAIFTKISKDKNLLWNYEKILDSLTGTFETNISADETLKFTGLISTDWQIEQQNLEVSGSGSEYTYTFPDEKKFVFYQNAESIAKVKTAIKELLAEK